MSYRVRYQDFVSGLCPNLVAISDPIAFGQLAVDVFLDTYKPLLETLDGRDLSSFIDFYFTPSPCNNAVLEFVDEDAKLDFLDLAVDMHLIPALEEICRGCEEKSFAVPSKHIQPKKIKQDKNKKQLLCAQRTLDVIQVKLANTKDIEEQKKLQAKLVRATKMLEQAQYSL